MTGYLAAIGSRDLSPSVRDSEPESQPHRTVPASPILPRLPSEYETWRIAAVDEAAAVEMSDEIEPPVTSQTVETRHTRARGDKRSEVNPSAESQKRQADTTASTEQKIDSRRQTPHESSSIATTQARSDTQSPAREPHTSRTSERRRENVVVHAVSKEPVDLSMAAGELTLPTASRRTQRTDATVPASSHSLIIPQIRESAIAPLADSGFKGHARHSGEMNTAEKSEPSVVVTIGRIEVRAVTRPSPPRSSPERQQLMSLDEYLKQRVRGLR